MPDRAERRLTAILAADVVGYSRLMGADEEGTLAALKAIRRELVDPKIVEHRGRIVKTTGDGLLVEFASVVDAVRCAVDVQREMAERNAVVPPVTASNSASASISATSSSMGTTSSATASTSPLGSKPWPSRAGSASAAWCATRCATSSPSRSRTWASSRSRISPGRCGSIGYATLGAAAKSPTGGGSDRCCAARQAVDRGIAVRQYERRSRAGIFRRRHGRGDHYRALAASAGSSSSPAIRASPIRGRPSM